jgi:hypothetical protein
MEAKKFIYLQGYFLDIICHTNSSAGIRIEGDCGACCILDMTYLLTSP